MVGVAVHRRSPAARPRLARDRLDFSPYLRPRAWAAAIVVADAVLWNGAAPALARSFAGSATGRDHLGRALIFRMAAEQLATDPRHGAHLEPYRRVLSAVA